jgi:hypothetical protein
LAPLRVLRRVLRLNREQKTQVLYCKASSATSHVKQRPFQCERATGPHPARSKRAAPLRGKSAQRMELICGRRTAQYKLQIARRYLRTLARPPFAMRPDLFASHDRVCEMLRSRIPDAVRLRSRFARGHFNK